MHKKTGLKTHKSRHKAPSFKHYNLIKSIWLSLLKSSFNSGNIDFKLNNKIFLNKICIFFMYY